MNVSISNVLPVPGFQVAIDQSPSAISRIPRSSVCHGHWVEATVSWPPLHGPQQSSLSGSASCGDRRGSCAIGGGLGALDLFASDPGGKDASPDLFADRPGGNTPAGTGKDASPALDGKDGSSGASEESIRVDSHKRQYSIIALFNWLKDGVLQPGPTPGIGDRESIMISNPWSCCPTMTQRTCIAM